MFEIRLSNNASKFYLSANEKLAARINNALNELTINPYYGKNIKKLRGVFEGLFRYRLADFRIVYSVGETIRIVSIVWIGKRKDAYK